MQQSKQEIEKQIADKQKEIAELNKSLLSIEKQNEITNQISDYNDILRIGKYDESKDVVSIDNFSEEENKVISAIIKKMRICKVYNEGERIKRNEKRWYNWYDTHSGFAFYLSGYDSSYAYSASRLCLKNEKLLEDFTKKFQYIDEQIIDIQDRETQFLQSKNRILKNTYY